VKKVRIFLFVIIFMAALYIGYRVGFKTPSPVMPAEAEKSAATSVASLAGVLPNGQISLLLVTVDSLQAARPRLESVWLVELVPPDPCLTLLSVYPSFSGEEAQRDGSLAGAFRVEAITNSLQVGQAFLEALQNRNLFWSGTVLLDKYALAQTLDYLNLPQLQQSLSGDQTSDKPNVTTQPVGSLNGTAKLKAMPSASQNPQMALFAQASIYQELCQSAAQRNPVLDASSQEELAKLLDGHLFLDLDPKQVLPHLKAYQAPGTTLFCDFPALPIQSMSIK
jgi:hypothetical protein